MTSIWLYRLDTLGIVVALLVAMALARGAGAQVGRRRGHISWIFGSLLGLLSKIERLD